ncbi:methenyltetrahydrofolate synthase domain-containing protein lost [Haematobia irritans]|uniref:Putative 5-formyltetrahydrofolate cyclo-ligase n=2 Tax=Haematobia irritans TaxID=7368 RepID=A0A1L8E8X9_HAEIR
METQNTTPAAEAATTNGGNATQEVSSTTQSVEPTKRSLRVQTWRKIRDEKLSVHNGMIFNRIPTFVDSDKAVNLLAETDEFKKAKEIKVQIDRALNGVRLQTLLAGKNLYLPSTRNSKALYLKVDVPADATDEKKNEILNVRDLNEYRSEIGLENKVVFDMVVIGSVLVSRDGYRIGRGNGFNDLDIGLLISVGAITSNTIIVTVVHDSQVVDTLPTNIFHKHDAPVDLIVTPTEVIRVAKRLPRPAGLYWELLSERRLKIVPALELLKEAQEKEGKIITLKEEDTDIEQGRIRRRFNSRRRFGGRRFQRRTVSQNNANDQQQGDNGQQQKRNPSRKRRFINRRRRPTKSEGDQSGVESKSQERKSGGERKMKPRKNRPPRDFSVKLTNISRDVRVKDLKSELRNRECHPLAITWKGSYGRCYLHFGNRNGKPSTEEEMNKVLESLNNLSLTITPQTKAEGATNGEEGANASNAPEADADKTPKVVNLNVELIKYDKSAKKNADGGAPGAAATVNGGEAAAAGGDASSARIESVDTTTV